MPSWERGLPAREIAAGKMPSWESAASTPVFRSFTGRLLHPAQGADGTWSVPVGEEPLFFEGARLVTERL